MESPPAIIHMGSDVLAPLLVPFDVERDAVLTALLAQIKRVAKLLEPIAE